MCNGARGNTGRALAKLDVDVGGTGCAKVATGEKDGSGCTVEDTNAGGMLDAPGKAAPGKGVIELDSEGAAAIEETTDMAFKIYFRSFSTCVLLTD